jgi:putative PIG3 family NAD(P)H quinone oxidoreductase
VRAVLPPAEPHAAPRLGHLPDPVPGPGEALVAVAAAGLNHADLLQLRGQYPPLPGESEVPGLECAGRVVGGAGPWRPGQRVMALLGGGGQGTLVAVPAGQLMPLPDNLSDLEGAALPEAGLTGWTNLVAEGQLQAGETVLVTGATGGMGSFIVQLARELGARVLAAGRDPERLERLRPLGVGEVCLEGANLAQQVREATAGRGVDLVLDLVGGPHFQGHLGALRDGGRLVLVGLIAGPRLELDLSPVLRRRLRVIGSVLRYRPREEKARLVADFTAFALPRLRDGRLRPVVDRVFPLAAAAEAYKTFLRGAVFGKIVLDLAST